MENYNNLLELARSNTGLSDFGDDSFREGLEILVNALRNEARLNDTGEHVLKARILSHLEQRLKIEDWYRRHPEIDDEKIVAPLIGLSLPRTGSTALSFLLAQDPAARSLLRDEAAQPCPPPGARQSDSPAATQQNQAEAVPGWKSHTPSGPQAPAECQDLMALDFKSQMFQAFAQIPSYSEWMHNADLTSTYLYERRALKLLQWRRPAKPWRLKCPTHLIYLQDLNRAFPDARFVMTHRDPTDVILSVIDVYADIVSKFTDHMDMEYLADLNIQQWSDGMQRTLAFRSRNTNSSAMNSGNSHDRFFDIHFLTMQQDPVSEVRRLYQWLGEPVSDVFAGNMNQWWQENARNRQTGTRKQPADYGVEMEKVRPLFADYTRCMQQWTGQGATQ